MRNHSGIIASSELLNSAEVQQFFDRLITPPSSVRQTLYANLINALVADGTWALLDALVICASTIDASLVELKSGTFQPTVIGNPLFTSDLGFLCSGIANTIDSQWQPSTGSTHYTQNSAMVCAWNISAISVSNTALWRSGANINVECWPCYTGGITLSMANNASGEPSASNPGNTSGFYVVNRNSSNSYTVRRNNTLLGTHSNVSTTPESNNILFGFGAGAPNQFRLACYAFGGSLTSSQQTTLYTALQTYLTAVGAI